MLKVFYMVFVMVMAPMMARGAACNDDNPYYDPTYALCSVHSHNIGFAPNDQNRPQNPLSSAQIQEMNEVIGLKTTILVQQLKAQYDSLAATVKRLQSQLHKAVLTSQMEMMTGNVASTAGSSSSGSNNMLAGATDCNSKYGAEFWDCLGKNAGLVAQVVNTDKNSARKQLERDYNAAKMHMGTGEKIDDTYCPEKGYSNNENIEKCVKYLQAHASEKAYQLRQEERKTYYFR